MLAVRGGGVFDGVVSIHGPMLILMGNGRIVDVDTSGARPPSMRSLLTSVRPRCCLVG